MRAGLFWEKHDKSNETNTMATSRHTPHKELDAARRSSKLSCSLQDGCPDARARQHFQVVTHFDYRLRAIDSDED